MVAHHYVVNSGLFASGGPMVSNPISANTLYLALLGAWGKVGINCFLMITGYFMCTSPITVRKFIKLILQIYFYKLLLFPILLIGGYESLSLNRIVKLIMPVWGFSTSNFISCCPWQCCPKPPLSQGGTVRFLPTLHPRGRGGGGHGLHCRCD